MGLDVYVGPFTRYYAGGWGTIIQRMAREGDLPTVQIVRPNAPARGFLRRLFDHIRPASAHNVVQADVVQAVERWQWQLKRELNVADADWNEDPNGEYFTDKPAWDCYGALILWAAYDELPASHRREVTGDWENDPAVLTIQSNAHSRYRHLASDTEIWVPFDFDNPVRTTALTGEKAVVGSNIRLLGELQELNSRFWSAADTQISEWRREGIGFGAPLEISARFAFSLFYELTRISVKHRLPMKLDY